MAGLPFLTSGEKYPQTEAGTFQFKKGSFPLYLHRKDQITAQIFHLKW